MIIRNEETIYYDPDCDVLYNATSTGIAFHQSPARIKMLRGPVGSGKSSTCCNHALYLAKLQAPSKDGIRRTKGLVIRGSYSQLKTTTMETWCRWYPPEMFGEIRGNGPYRHRIRFDDVDMLVIFMSFEQLRHLSKLRSMDLSWVWINEASEIDYLIFEKASERINRFPLDKTIGLFPTKPEVFMDTNSPDATHWIYHLFEENSFAGYKMFAQPPAMIKVEDEYYINPQAENLENLAPNYYQTLIENKPENYINTMVLNKYGYQSDGRAVYSRTYNDALHCPETKPRLDLTLPIGLGWDFNRNPACAIVQCHADGNIVLLDEIIGTDISFENFLDDIAIPRIRANYPGYTFQSVGDPSGINRSGTNDSYAFAELAKRGFPTKAAPTNSPEVRIAGVEYFLTRMINGKPAFQITKNCVVARKGFNKDYCYEKLKVIGTEKYKDKPNKNSFSHIHDAIQYILLYYRDLASKPKSDFNISKCYRKMRRAL